MEFRRNDHSWKNPTLLLSAIGLSTIGDWIYLIALNLIVLDMTGSPLAVAALYILKPVSTLFTNFWAGSIIDRLNLRNFMVVLDVFRAALILIVPSLSSIWLIYLVVFFINMGSSVFEPASMTYITKLLPPARRQRFNALRGLVDSGGFLLGPAVAGILFMIGTPYTAIYVNAFTFLGSGLIMMCLPQFNKSAYKIDGGFSIGLLKKDWQVVLQFTRVHTHIITIYFLFSLMMVMATALDSLEAAFSKEVLKLSDTEYGFLVSIAGAGIAVGSIFNALYSKKLPVTFLIGVGSLFVSAGYIIYAFSSNFTIAALGFSVLSFSLAFANTGFYTFYQDNIPVDVMGRVGSFFSFIEAIFIIAATIIIGIAAQVFTIKGSVIVGSFFMLLITVVLGAMSYLHNEKIHNPAHKEGVIP
ncbi:MFS transporter [Pseudalkalibacillus sp. SCS-8]|uniref:MFS transporter n=1 Tax=Pseudalkalibacillus nanhaiensis TaxID=3115291 RepID=UPI0032DA324D